MSLSLFIEVSYLEVEEDLSTTATLVWAEGVWLGRWRREQLAVDMRVVCPQDVKKMLLKQARRVHWKKWAAKHKCEELKEGTWMEPIQAMLQRKTNDVWTDKHRHVTRELVVGGGWVQKRSHDIGWSDEKKVSRMYQRRKHGEAQIISLHRVGRRSETCSRAHRAKISQKDWKWQRGLTSHTPGEGRWKKGHLTVRKWESEKHKKLAHAS